MIQTIIVLAAALAALFVSRSHVRGVTTALGAALLLAVCLTGCSSSPSATTTPVSTQAVQRQGEDAQQGTAQVGETGSATIYNIAPNIIGAKRTLIGPDGSVEVEGADGATVEISGEIAGQQFGDNALSATVSSGGGAAGGTGGASRTTEGVGNRASGTVGAPTAPAPGGGGN